MALRHWATYVIGSVLVLPGTAASGQSGNECPRCAKKIDLSPRAWSCLVQEAQNKRSQFKERVILKVDPKTCVPKKGTSIKMPKVTRADTGAAARASSFSLTRTQAECIADKGEQMLATKSKTPKIVVVLAEFCP